jgi:hypothetical protein
VIDYAFSVISEERTLVLFAGSETEKDEWMDAIMGLCLLGFLRRRSYHCLASWGISEEEILDEEKSSTEGSSRSALSRQISRAFSSAMDLNRQPSLKGIIRQLSAKNQNGIARNLSKLSVVIADVKENEMKGKREVSSDGSSLADAVEVGTHPTKRTSETKLSLIVAEKKGDDGKSLTGGRSLSLVALDVMQITKEGRERLRQTPLTSDELEKSSESISPASAWQQLSLVVPGSGKQSNRQEGQINLGRQVSLNFDHKECTEVTRMTSGRRLSFTVVDDGDSGFIET